MKSRARFLLVVWSTFILLPAFAMAAQEEGEPKTITIKVFEPGESPIVETSGRLKLEKHGPQQWFILHAKDGQGYLIKGKLDEDLKKILADLGEENMVSLAGKKEGGSSVSCHNAYSFDEKGEKKVKTSCIRYYYLDVFKIGEAKKSSQKLPPLKRDPEAEKKTLATTFTRQQGLSLVQYVTIERGIIQSLNMRSPIKTMEVSYKDKNGKSITKAMLINKDVRVAKKKIKMDDTKEPFLDVGINSLKVGQEVTIVYAQDELKNEATVITVTKDIE